MASRASSRSAPSRWATRRSCRSTPKSAARASSPSTRRQAGRVPQHRAPHPAGRAGRRRPGILALSPRANRIIIEEGGKLLPLSLRNPHPEVSFSALWGKVWYENYDEPKYVWQSTAANTDFEPKLSLSPLTFGTLKAAFYAMILAAPLAIAAAIYTAYFMAPGMRRKVKPVIELMEAMPTVILGFFAGLFLAPYLEGHLPGVFSLLLLLPIGILVAGFAWSRLPESIRLRVPDGWEARS
jgi:phosphate transport system permease protein